ncbi:hypothetical protein K469DRAFT_785597 [Zopfia rhizophila CBS 207.26]|uniref:Fungal N-terminal domain-containing protein n=1 Tax=Zopfia rhizophila CBS 207.26 TaxID=1314779 RepID=A0A6A6DYZ7_9PEZI|nr:hypothetical protein K469DRAFT_785597 [Zopfia rhizophila CBS 207.26]
MAEASGVAGVSLAVPSIVALRGSSKYKDAESRLYERGTILQDYLHKFHLKIEEFTILSPNLPNGLSANFAQLFIVLKQKIAGFDVELEGLAKADKVLGVKSVLSSIGNMIEMVNIWQRKIEDFFELLARIPKTFKGPRAPNPSTALGRVKIVNEAILIATENTEEALKPSENQIPGNLRQLPNSSAFILEAGQSALMEVKAIAPDRNKNIEAITSDVADHAIVLSAQDIATRGILRCT